MTLTRGPAPHPAVPTTPPTTAPAALVPAHGAGRPRPLERRHAVVAQLRDALADAVPRTGYARALAGVGLLLLAAGVVHAAVWLADGTPWEGAVSWRKPILFCVSFGLFALSAAWVQHVLPRSALAGWTTTGLVAVGGLGEVGLISAQQWRGTASHFNVLTSTDATVFILMGVTIGIFGAGTVLLAAWVVRRLRHPAPTVLAVVVGLGLVLLASALGGDLMGRGMSYVATHDAVPSAVVVGAAGSGKLAHAVALHGLQVLGVLALLLGRSGLSPTARTRSMVLGATGYVALTALVIGQAYAGRAPLDLTPATGLASVLAPAAVVAAFGWALRPALLGTPAAATATPATTADGRPIGDGGVTG
ncbi:hypothetical protein [uncultured Cellulomonas sp.]|uniref:hypothetical protein n=1 Tax=uncultured Cellulomonas sp. TaxID=189682 RepID=UPI00260A4421|nr:hypothetical protein [uncultured Cellulomonas sp.]